MANYRQPDLGNHLLSCLPSEEYDVLAPHLSRVTLPLRTVIHPSGAQIAAVYFLESGYASMMATLEDGGLVEVGMIGKEGVVGLPVILGADHSVLEALIQTESIGIRLDAGVLRSAMDDRPNLRRHLLRTSLAHYFQVAMTAACNGRHVVEQRLARWLLTAHDRVGSDDLVMTHEFLATMLGVRRAGISDSAASLQRSGAINYSKGRIQILDRRRLEQASCECYRVVQAEFNRLVADAPAKSV